jgi:hypothetical protein
MATTDLQSTPDAEVEAALADAKLSSFGRSATEARARCSPWRERTPLSAATTTGNDG